MLIIIVFALAAQTAVAARSGLGAEKAVWALTDLLGCPAHPSLRKAELLSFALEDLVRSCTYRLVQAFGASVTSVVKEAKQKPAFGSGAEVSAILLGLLSFQQ